MNWKDAVITAVGILFPLGLTIYLFRDQILRSLGFKQILIVYFNQADYESVAVLKRFFGLKADVLYLPPSVSQLPPQALGYKYIIFLGGQAINPFYRSLMQAGQLPPITQPGQYVIKQIGNYIFIAGYEKEETFNATSKFIQALSSGQSL